MNLPRARGARSGDARDCGKGGVTMMRITQANDSKDARDGAIASGMDQGMEAGYKQLDAVLARPV